MKKRVFYLAASTLLLFSGVAQAQDQNGDGVVDSTDIDTWYSCHEYLEYYYGSPIPAWAAPWMDLDGDLIIDFPDRDRLICLCGALLGDANCDGVVNSTDLNIVNANWQQTGRGWRDGDFNGDRKVDSADLNILALHWGQTTECPGGNEET